MMIVLWIAFWIVLALRMIITLQAMKYAIFKTPIWSIIAQDLFITFIVVPFGVIGLQMIFNLPTFSYLKALYTGYWGYLFIWNVISSFKKD